MTVQIEDTVFYRDREYNIAGINGAGLFVPSEHGPRAVMMSTACVRGYFCNYEIRNETLYLAAVHIRAESQISIDQKPKLYGVVPQIADAHKCFVYDGLHQVMPFTGGLLLGSELLRSNSVGFQFRW